MNPLKLNFHTAMQILFHQVCKALIVPIEKL